MHIFIKIILLMTSSALFAAEKEGITTTAKIQKKEATIASDRMPSFVIWDLRTETSTPTSRLGHVLTLLTRGIQASGPRMVMQSSEEERQKELKQNLWMFFEKNIGIPSLPSEAVAREHPFDWCTEIYSRMGSPLLSQADIITRLLTSLQKLTSLNIIQHNPYSFAIKRKIMGDTNQCQNCSIPSQLVLADEQASWLNVDFETFSDAFEKAFESEQKMTLSCTNCEKPVNLSYKKQLATTPQLLMLLSKTPEKPSKTTMGQIPCYLILKGTKFQYCGNTGKGAHDDSPILPLIEFA